MKTDFAAQASSQGSGMLVVLSLMVLAAVLGGCRYVSFEPETARPGGQSTLVKEMFVADRLRVPDLPFPAGFELDAAKSRTIATHGNVRVVSHLYTGSGDLTAAGDFYRREMPRKGWASASEQFAYGELRLRFVKGNERCEINIKPGYFGHLIIEASIFPENIAATP